ncbi:hypothetical protein GCM10027168_70930 [Streptomyces capparidis]
MTRAVEDTGQAAAPAAGHQDGGQHGPLVRALRIADPEQRLAAYYEATGEPVVNLGIADNVLLYPLLKRMVFDRATVEEDDIRYKAPPYGLDRLREDVGRLLRASFSPAIDWRTDVFATAGVSGALESLAFALRDGGVLEPGDRVLLPAPCWQGFRWCFEQRPGLHCVPVHPDRFELTLRDIQDAYRLQPPRPRLLVLTNPQNPLGVNHSRDLLEEICSWVMSSTDMHIVTDEIYAHSQIETADPPFTSVLSLDTYAAHPDRIHLVWGLGKDFGLSGFRTGFLVSKSPPVRKVMRGDPPGRAPLSWFGPLDSLKNVYLRRLFAAGQPGEPWLPRELMDAYRGLLTEAHHRVADALDRARIDYVGRGRSGRNPAQFFLLDLRRYLRWVPPGSPGLFPEIHDKEAALDTWITRNAHVQLLPGQTLSCPEPGYFRLCFTAYEPRKVCDAVAAIRKALDRLPPDGEG